MYFRKSVTAVHVIGERMGIQRIVQFGVVDGGWVGVVVVCRPVRYLDSTRRTNFVST
jgi:energy-converting hydrogenase Eha subunit C